ncbi:MAG: hypothetical protein JNL96_01775 [Planctomycetaceae bacterium]|nr:hypothetical protein [Planctomycetaceae bacterium]
MRKAKSPSRSPLVLSRYDELVRYGEAFAGGHLNLLILTGGPGLGKSRLIKSLVDQDACWIDGHTTAFGMYVRLYRHRGRPLVIDDVDDLHNNREAVRLLKSLCQTDREKTVSWNSGTRQLDKLGVPHQFQTTGTTAIIANDWERLNLDVEALEDRGHVVHFAPSALEVHLQAAQWFTDQEVFDFIGARSSYFEQPSFRNYVTAAELKRAGLDWKQATLARCLNGKRLVVAQLKADVGFASEEERAQAFVAFGHGCRATYFNIAKKLPAVVDPPPLILKMPAAMVEQATEPTPDLFAILKRRHGQLGNG